MSNTVSTRRGKISRLTMTREGGTWADQHHRDDMAEALRSTEHTSREEPIIDRLRRVVSEQSAKRIDGQLVDLFTASAIVQVHDALSEQNKAKLLAMPLPKMATTAFKVLEKARA